VGFWDAAEHKEVPMTDDALLQTRSLINDALTLREHLELALASRTGLGMHFWQSVTRFGPAPPAEPVMLRGNETPGAAW
jgi:hypothetical protein